MSPARMRESRKIVIVFWGVLVSFSALKAFGEQTSRPQVEDEGVESLRWGAVTEFIMAKASMTATVNRV